MDMEFLLGSRKSLLNAKLLIIASILASFRNIQVEGQTPERRYACWGSFGPPVVSAQCPRNTVIQIIRAGLKVQNHVGLCAYNDNDCGCEYGQKGCQMQDVRQLCMGRPACRLDVTQQYINTPTCRGFSDYMYIEFNCVPVEKNSVSDICSFTKARTESGYMKSPTSPISSRVARECECSLTTEPDSRIQLSLLDYKTEDAGCDHSHLEVSYGGQSVSYCRQQTEKIDTNTNNVNIKFGADGQGGQTSFWLKYTASPPNPIKLQCSHRTIEITTHPLTTTTEKILSTTLRNPKIYKPRQRNKKKDRLKNNNVLVDRTTTQENTTPWWWRFTDNGNATGYIRDGEITTFTSLPADRNLGRDPSKSRRYHTKSATPSSRSSSSSTSSTSNRYQHPNPANPKAIAGKLSPYFDPKLNPPSNFEFSQSDAASYSRDSHNSQNLWSHLPTSLLKKLQFPLPLIKALEKELSPNDKTDRSYLRVLPELQSNGRGESARKAYWRKKQLMHEGIGEDSYGITKPDPTRFNSSRVNDKDTSSDVFKSFGRHNREWLVTSTPFRPNPEYSNKMKFTNMKEASEKLGIRNLESHNGDQSNAMEAKMKGQGSRPSYPFLKSRNGDKLRYKARRVVEMMAKPNQNKGGYRRYRPYWNYTSTPVPPRRSTTATTTASYYASSMVPHTTTGRQEGDSLEPKNKRDPKGRVFKSGRIRSDIRNGRTSLKGSEGRKLSPRGQRYKVPTSKIAVQPVTWNEPMDTVEKTKGMPKYRRRMFPRERSQYGDRRRYRTRYRYDRKYSDSKESKEDQRKRAYRRKRMRKYWENRFEPEKPKIVSPEPRMYVNSENKRINESLKQTGMSNRSNEISFKNGSIQITTPKPTSTHRPTNSTVSGETTLIDSVHRDNFNVVEELVGKVQTVSDFYKTLNEEDWTSWPAFENVKTSQDLEPSLLTFSDFVKSGDTIEPIPEISPIQFDPDPEPEPIGIASTTLSYRGHPPGKTHHPPTTTRTYTMTTKGVRPPHASPTLDNSIPQMPQSTKMASASSMTVPVDKVRRRTPGDRSKINDTPNQTESLQDDPQSNMITIIAACVVGSILLLIIVGIVIRFIMKRNQDREDGIHFASAKGLSRKPSSTNFDGRKIPRPKRV